jgi:glycosyltransferase involved in cell wall biosynthesis
VATRVGGIPEVIEDGMNGFLAEVGDIETMAQRTTEILKDESKLREMGKRARRSAQARFCSTKIIPQYEEFYRAVLERTS